MRGLSIRSPFGRDLPKPMEPFYLEYQVVRLRDGLLEECEKHEIIMSHTRLAIALASSWGRKAPHLINDLVQECLCGMIRALDLAPKLMYNNNITGFLIQRAKNAMFTCMDGEQIVPYWRRREMLTINPDILFPTYKEYTEQSRTDYDLRLMAIMDQILVAIERDQNFKRREYKKVIVRLRASGYTAKEISEIIDVHRHYVRNMLKQIEQEYERINNHGETSSNLSITIGDQQVSS